jgi:hypothetical protein
MFEYTINLLNNVIFILHFLCIIHLIAFSFVYLTLNPSPKGEGLKELPFFSFTPSPLGEGDGG